MEDIRFDRRIVMISIVALTCLTLARTATAQVSSGLDSAEGAQINGCDGSGGACGTTPFDTLWADSSVQRWRMNNHTVSTPLIVAQWPCVHGGCIPYSGTTQTAGVFPETELQIGAQGSLLTSTGTIPSWSSTPTLGTVGTLGTLSFAGNTSGTVKIQPQAAAGTYNFNLPTSAGSIGQPLLSGGGSSSAMTFGTLTVAAGGTGQITLTNHGVLVGAGTSAITQLSAAASGTILMGLGSTSDPSFTPTPTLGVAGTTLGTLSFAGNTSGAVKIQPQAAAGTYNFNLPTGAGLSGQPLISGGGGSAAMSYGGVTGTATTFATANANFIAANSGQAVSIDSNGNAQASGANAGPYSIPWNTVSNAIASTTATFDTGLNKETLWGVTLTFPLTTTQITYKVGTQDNTSNSYGLGILNSAGTVILHIGPTAGSTIMTTGTHSVSWVEGSTTLQPGKYYLVQTTNCSTSCAALAGANSNAITFLEKSVVSVTAGGTVQTVTPPADTYSWIGSIPAWAVR